MTAIITYRVLLSNMLRCSYVLGDSYLVARSVRCEIPHMQCVRGSGETEFCLQ